MILRHYLMRQVLITTSLVLVFLVIMLLGGRFIRYFGMAADGGLQASVLFRLIGYNLPFFLELILPLAFFIGLMLVFGRMYADNEMAVLNAAGISRGQLGRYLLPVLLLMMMLEAGLSLWAKPWGVRSSENIWQAQKLLEAFDLVKPKQFISRGHYHLYVDDIGPNREYVSGVVIVQTADKADDKTANKDVIIIAQKAMQVASDDDKMQIELYDGRRYEIDTLQQGYNQVGFGRYRMTLELSKNKDSQLLMTTLPLVELINIAKSHDRRALAELAYRFALPWLMVIALLYALPLSRVRPRQGRWGKIMPAILLFVMMALVLISIKKPIEQGKVDVMLYPMVIVWMLMIGVYANYHTRLVSHYRLLKAERQP